jgi:predicted ester cyclase
MTRPEIEALFAKREEALAQHDPSAFTALYAADAVVESPTAGRVVRGREEIEALARAWFSGFPDVIFKRVALLIDGDRAAWVGEVEGTDDGGFLGLAPTRKAFRLAMLMLSTVRDSAIVHEQRIYDFTGMLIQIGILKAKPM